VTKSLRLHRRVHCSNPALLIRARTPDRAFLFANYQLAYKHSSLGCRPPGSTPRPPILGKMHEPFLTAAHDTAQVARSGEHVEGHRLQLQQLA